jgi:uncharacterized circularly permuted ATP-grasp superfamily protein
VSSIEPAPSLGGRDPGALAAGLAQRVRALEAWCADVYARGQPAHAELLGVPLIEPHELDVTAVDVLYRHTNGDRLDHAVGRLLEEPWLAGRLALVNAFGIGVGDDKLAHAYVEDMVRYYLGP